MENLFGMLGIGAALVTIASVMAAFFVAAHNRRLGTHATNKSLKFVSLLASYAGFMAVFVPIFVFALMSGAAGSGPWPFAIAVGVVAILGNWLVNRFGRFLYGRFGGNSAYW